MANQEYADFYNNQEQNAIARTVPGANDDPDAAARAMDISQNTGIDPALVYPNLDTIEGQYKAHLIQQMVRNNPHIQDYINSNPLAAKISADDWGNLHNVSQAVQQVPKQSSIAAGIKRAREIMDAPIDAVLGTLREGLGPQRIGSWIPDSQYNEMMQSPQGRVNYALISAIGAPFEFGLARGPSAAIHGLATAIGTPIDKLTGRTDTVENIEQFATDPNTLVQLSGLPIPNLLMAAEPYLARARATVQKAKPYVDTGVEPPVGLDSLIDHAKADQSKADVKAIYDALTEAQKSNTKARNPEMFRQFIQQHDPADISINVDAVRRLYGDTVPMPDDGILGWVPGIEDQILTRSWDHGDIHVPLADWLAHMDPAVAKELRDYTRVRPGGLTLEETKLLKPLDLSEDPRGPLPGEPAQRIKTLQEMEEAQGMPRAQTQKMVDGVAETAGLGPRVRLVPAEIQPHTYGGIYANTHEFDFVDREGNKVGDVQLEMQGTNVHIDYIRGTDEQMWRLGPAVLYDLAKQLKERFPDLKTFSGVRISGAREKFVEPTFTERPEDDPRYIKRPLPRFGTEAHDLFEPLTRTMFGGDTIDFGGGLYAKTTGAFTQKEAQVHDAVNKVLDKIVKDLPRGQRVAARDLELEGRPIQGVYDKQRNIPFILWALDSPDAIGSVRHEAIHFLRRNGFFTPQEWSALRNEAVTDGWIKKYDIRRRYQGESLAIMLEEAVAEHFAHINRADYWTGELTGVDKIMGKLRNLYEQIRTAVRGILGKDADYRDVIAKIEKGEVGSRGALEGEVPEGQPMAQRELDFARGHVNERQILEARIRQIQYDRNLSRKRGVDVTGEDYAATRNEIKQIRERLKDLELGPAPQRPKGEQLSMAEMTRMEDRDLFAKANAAGMTVKSYRQLLEQIEEKFKKDDEFAKEQNRKHIERRQTKEWKEQEKAISAEIRAHMEQRPDLAADKFLREGILHGEKIQGRPRLNSEMLSEEQKKALPNDYHTPGGIHPDDLASLFGFHSGDELVGRLGQIQTERGNLKPGQHLQKIVAQETAQRMLQQHGDLAKNILDEAEDHVVSSNMDIMSEELFAAAEKAGAQLSFTKENLKQFIKSNFEKMVVKGLSVRDFFQHALKADTIQFRAMLDQDAQEAMKQQQARVFALGYAREAKMFEREQKKFNRLTAKYKDREPSGVGSDYTNYIHQIMERFDLPVNRSAADLATEIREKGYGTLKEFIDHLNEGEHNAIDLGDMVMDPNFRKPASQLTVEEFRDLNNALIQLDKMGRMDKKAMVRGRAENVADISTALQDALKAQYKAKSKKLQEQIAIDFIRKYLTTGMLNPETWANRFDHGDLWGMWNQAIIRPLADAANREARLGRTFGKLLLELGEVEDGEKLIRSPINELGTNEPLSGFNRKNVAAIISNWGNEYNRDVLSKGWGADQAHLNAWLSANTTRADWQRAEKLGKIFNELFEEAQTVYRNIYGVAPPKIELTPFTIQTKDGPFTSDGWFHPIIRDTDRTNAVRPRTGQELLEQDKGMYPSIANGYTKRRTGKIDVLDLSHDMVPYRMQQIVHDIAFRAEIIDVAKILRDPSLRSTMRERLGKQYVNMFDTWLADIAGRGNVNGEAMQALVRASAAMRTNVIGTLIGFNPSTVLKHGFTAAVNSVYETGANAYFAKAAADIGMDRFRAAVHAIWGGDEVRQNNVRQFIHDNSEEIQRRSRHWQESFGGAQRVIEGERGWRDRIIEWGSKPVAISDMLSSEPTWLGNYQKAIDEGRSHGDAVYAGDVAVRRAHGSTAITNLPELVRQSGAHGSWLTSLYGFFSTQMQRRAEIAFHANDAFKFVKQGEMTKAGKELGRIVPLMFAAVIWPTIVEEVVSGIGTDDHRTGLQRLVQGGWTGLASSFLFIRDLQHGYGLGQTAVEDMQKSFNDLRPDKIAKSFDRQHAGKTVQDLLTTVGIFTGMAPTQVGRVIRFGMGVRSGTERPQGPGDVGVGLMRGTVKPRVVR